MFWKEQVKNNNNMLLGNITAPGTHTVVISLTQRYRYAKLQTKENIDADEKRLNKDLMLISDELFNEEMNSGTK